MTTRTHFTFRIDMWSPDGSSIIEHIAGVEDFQIAQATYTRAPSRSSAQHPAVEATPAFSGFDPERQGLPRRLCARAAFGASTCLRISQALRAMPAVRSKRGPVHGGMHDAADDGA